MELVSLTVLVIATGLLAGFFFAYWCSVMIGLRQVGDTTFVETMQHINTVLPNARFALPFFAPVVLSPVNTWLMFANEQTVSGWWCMGTIVFSVITFAITAACNVPMNIALANAGVPHSDQAARETRAAFESPWTRWNDIRTATSALAFVAAVCALATFN